MINISEPRRKKLPLKRGGNAYQSHPANPGSILAG